MEQWWTDIRGVSVGKRAFWKLSLPTPISYVTISIFGVSEGIRVVNGRSSRFFLHVNGAEDFDFSTLLALEGERYSSMVYIAEVSNVFPGLKDFDDHW